MTVLEVTVTLSGEMEVRRKKKKKYFRSLAL